MAHLFIFPQKDSTIFSRESLRYQNSGRDEILEIEKTYQDLDAPGNQYVTEVTLPSISRTLIQFNLDDVSEKIRTGQIVNPRFVLNLKTVEALEIPLAYSIEAFPVSQSWEMGTGRKYDEVTTTGVSWKFRDAATQTGKLWYHYDTITPTLVGHSDTVCWSGSWSGFWKGLAYGRFDGVFHGYYSGSFNSSSVEISSSILETENFLSYFTAESYSTFFITENLSTLSGSFTGSFKGFVSGSFSGSVTLSLYSSSIQYLTQDNSPTDISGGGTWYLSPSSSIQGGCLDRLNNPVCSQDIFESQSMDSEDTSSFVTSSFHLVASQSFNYEASDISMDVTNIVSAWINGTIPNNGFLLKHSDECSDIDYGQLRFFSMDTNTIYVPTLDCQWDDSQYNPTGSSDPITDGDKVVYCSNIRPEYKAGSVSRFDVFGRERYPSRTFSRTSDYLVSQHLPSSSYYAIKDADSEEYWIGFDNYSKISCDANGNYFNLNTSGLPQERYFKVQIKIEQNGVIDYFEDPTIFKITR